MAQIEHFDDLGFTVIAELDGDHVSNFRVYEITGTDGGHRFYGENCRDHAFEEADVYLHGFVKWDGCSNWHFDAQDPVMLHFCEREEAVAIGVLLGRLYDMAAKIIPAWSGE